MSEPLPLSHCTACGYPLNGAFDTEGDRHVPKEGDFSICIECGAVMVYRADQTLRAMTTREWGRLKADERQEIERAQSLIDTVKMHRTDHK
jgi:hypothetical protein